jgi:hypothetical protein
MAGMPEPHSRNTFSGPVDRARDVLGGIRRAWYHGAKIPGLAPAMVAEAAIVCTSKPAHRARKAYTHPLAFKLGKKPS